MPQKREEFDFLGISRWHALGIKGKGITIASKESIKGEHGANVYDIIRQVCPEANIRYKVDYTKDDDWDIFTTSAWKPKEINNNDIIEKLNKENKILFCSAGNTGNEKCSATSKAGMLSVGACKLINGKVKLASYSARCEHLDFVSFSGIDTEYDKNINGTSFSAPLLAGMVALIQCYFLQTIGRKLTYDELLEYLIKNSVDLGDGGRDDKYGHGLLILPESEENMEIKLGINNKLAYVNGKEVMLDTEPIIHCNRTMVPIRFIAETFGCNVEWDEKEREVTIVK